MIIYIYIYIYIYISFAFSYLLLALVDFTSVCLFLAALGLACYSQALSRCSELELLFAAVSWLLTAMASLQSMVSSQAGFSSWRAWVQ